MIDPTRLSPISRSYSSDKLARARGRAAAQACADCGKQASVWSLNPHTEHEQTDGRHRWSSDVFAYAPRCSPCHRAVDHS